MLPPRSSFKGLLRVRPGMIKIYPYVTSGGQALRHLFSSQDNYCISNVDLDVHGFLLVRNFTVWSQLDLLEIDMRIYRVGGLIYGCEALNSHHSFQMQVYRNRAQIQDYIFASRSNCNVQ